MQRGAGLYTEPWLFSRHPHMNTQNESVRLFHAQFGGVPSSAEWGNTRKGKHEKRVEEQNPFLNHPALSLIAEGADEADWFVYEIVRDR